MMTNPGRINDGLSNKQSRQRRRILVSALVGSIVIAVIALGLGMQRDSGAALAEESPVALNGSDCCKTTYRRVGCRASYKKKGPLRRLFASCSRRRKCCLTKVAEDPYAWKSLFDGKTLDGWKVPNFGGEGEVLIEDGAIVMETGSYMTGITWKGEPPRENYELELEGMRLQGSDFFCTTTFPVGDKTCSFVVGGWGGTVTGLSNVDFYDAVDNLTTDFIEFKDKQWYRVRIRVTKDYVRTWIGDRRMVNQEREGHTFGIRDEVYLCQPLGISTWDTTGAVRNIRIRLIDPDAEEPEEDETNP